MTPPTTTGRRRRSTRLLALVVSALTACSAPAAGPAAGPSERCGPVETVELQGGGHLIGDQTPPVPYNSTPPTSGWHSSGDLPPVEVRAPVDPLSEPEQVSVLEAGGAVVTYAGLSDEDRAVLEDAVRERFPERVAVTPYPALGDGQVAFTAWGTVQRCDGLDLDALAAFVQAYTGSQAVAPGGH